MGSPGGLHPFSKCLVVFDPCCNDFVLHQPRVDGTEPPRSDHFIMGFHFPCITLSHLSTHMRCINSAIRICRRWVAPLRWWQRCVSDVDLSGARDSDRLSLFCLGHGVRERWCVAHPCLVWENSPWWWFEFKGVPLICVLDGVLVI